VTYIYGQCTRLACRVIFITREYACAVRMTVTPTPGAVIPAPRDALGWCDARGVAHPGHAPPP
jgi:hypothetical protein